jgi:hypothetical protein
MDSFPLKVYCSLKQFLKKIILGYIFEQDNSRLLISQVIYEPHLC